MRHHKLSKKISLEGALHKNALLRLIFMQVGVASATVLQIVHRLAQRSEEVRGSASESYVAHTTRCSGME